MIGASDPAGAGADGPAVVVEVVVLAPDPPSSWSPSSVWPSPDRNTAPIDVRPLADPPESGPSVATSIRLTAPSESTSTSTAAPARPQRWSASRRHRDRSPVGAPAADDAAVSGVDAGEGRAADVSASVTATSVTAVDPVSRSNGRPCRVAWRVWSRSLVRRMPSP